MCLGKIFFNVKTTLSIIFGANESSLVTDILKKTCEDNYILTEILHEICANNVTSVCTRNKRYKEYNMLILIEDTRN